MSGNLSCRMSDDMSIAKYIDSPNGGVISYIMRSYLDLYLH